MQFEHVTCPHCGILCDDLSVKVSESSIIPLNISDPLCVKAYEQASFDAKNTHAKIKGNRVSTAEAIEASVKILTSSSQPLISGLIADVQACREAVKLTEKVRGVIDHANGSGMRANISVMQRIGKVKTTLAEVRNRADNVIIFGSEILDRFPRLLDRVLLPEKSLGPESTINKNIYVLDANNKKQDKSFAQDNIHYQKFSAENLEAIIHGLGLIIHTEAKPKDNDTLMREIYSLHEEILNSQYSVLIWSTSLLNPASAEQSVQSLTQSIKTLMREKRCVGLPLGGSKGEITASQVITWQAGLPLPVAFMTGAPVHDPQLYDGATMLQNNEADALVWVSTYSPDDAPPSTSVPTIVIGHPGMQISNETEVFIPVGIPGIDTRGLVCRTDSVATLPLQKIRDSELPSASDVLNKIIGML